MARLGESSTSTALIGPDHLRAKFGSTQGHSFWCEAAGRAEVVRFSASRLQHEGESSGRLVQFRDVFEVDGQPVRDRSDRLLTMFTQPTDATASQTRRIADESARYNIGHMIRNINVPVLPLRFLHPSNRWRFKFSLKSRGAGPSVTADLPQSPTFRVATEVWVIEYRETEARTMIRTIGQSDLSSRGRFWIEPSSGRVLMSEFIAEDSNLQARIDVSYQSEPLVDLYVPVEMHETYRQRNYPYRITGTATSSNFRRFDVTVNESFRLIGR